MAKHITIKEPGQHQQTGELTTFDLKSQRIYIDFGGHAVSFLLDPKYQRRQSIESSKFIYSAMTSSSTFLSPKR